METDSPGNSEGTVAQNGAPEQESTGNDVIRDQSEVFEMARGFDLFGGNQRG
jgi:hypothetical protein